MLSRRYVTTLYDAATTPSQIPSVQWSPHLSTHVADSKPLQLVKVIFHCQIQKLTKESGDLEEELDFTLCTNISGSDQVLITTCLHLEQTSPFLYVFLHIAIHVINMLVALCTALWSYLLPSSQLKYFSQGCAT